MRTLLNTSSLTNLNIVMCIMMCKHLYRYMIFLPYHTGNLTCASAVQMISLKQIFPSVCKAVCVCVCKWVSLDECFILRVSLLCTLLPALTAGPNALSTPAAVKESTHSPTCWCRCITLIGDWKNKLTSRTVWGSQSFYPYSHLHYYSAPREPGCGIWSQ